MANRYAPLPVKLNVLKTFVVNSLYNCETFGNRIPQDLENTYVKLIKCAFRVRSNTPNLLLYGESGFLPIKAMVHSKQLKFYRILTSNIAAGSRRDNLMKSLLEGTPTPYLQNYVKLDEKYGSTSDIYKEYIAEVKSKITINTQKWSL